MRTGPKCIYIKSSFEMPWAQLQTCFFGGKSVGQMRGPFRAKTIRASHGEYEKSSAVYGDFRCLGMLPLTERWRSDSGTNEVAAL
jgi:hypothetical protein